MTQQRRHAGWWMAAQWLTVAALYVATGKLGFLVAIAPGNVTTVWPPSGLALAAVLLAGAGVGPGIWLGAFLVNVWFFLTAAAPMSAGAWCTAALIASGSTLQALAGAGLLRRVIGTEHLLDQTRHVFGFIVVAMSSCLLGASVGVTTLAWSGYVPWTQYVHTWWTWWLGDITGMLVVTPLLWTWCAQPWKDRAASRIVEFVWLQVALMAISQVTFGHRTPYSIAFILIPLVMWMAFRFGRHGVTSSTLVVSMMAVWYTAHGLGPFAHHDPGMSLALLQLYIGIVTMTGLVLAAALTERRRAEQALCHAYDTLEQEVAARTADLGKANRELREEILARRQAEEALRASESRFRQLTNADIIGMIEADLQGRILVANDAFLQMVGYTREDVLAGRVRWDAMTPEEWRQRDREAVEQIQRWGSARPFEKEYFHQDGHRIPVLVGGTLLEGSTDTVLCFVLNLTEQKWAQEALRDANRRLSDLARLVEYSEDAIIGKTLDGMITSWNHGAEQLYGYTEAEAIGQPITMIVPSDRAEELQEIFNRLRRGEAIENLETVRMRKGGAPVHVAISISPVRDVAGTPVGASIIARDITDRIQAEAAVRRAHEELQVSHEALKTMQLQLIQSAKLESVGRLAAGVAHEVKNPLAIIYAGLEYIGKYLHQPDRRVAMALGDMRLAVQRADAVIRGLLDFSVLREVAIQPEPLHEVLEDALRLVKYELDKAHVQVHRALADELPPLPLDRQKIEQVLVNLLLNAAQAMPQGGTLTVRTVLVSLAELLPRMTTASSQQALAGGAVVLDVDDTGPGIPADKLSKVFDPFFTTKPTGQGTGLGLTVSRRIVELHGGELLIGNRPAGGVRATVILPLKGGEQHGQKAHPDHRRRAELRTARAGLPGTDR